MKPRILAALAALSIAAPAGASVFITAAAAESASATIASGGWEKKSFASAGTWSIVERDGRKFVVLSADFSTKNAPDLKIFLSPKAGADLNGRNATEGSVLIAPLASNKGAQEYEIPAGVDLSAYKSIIIHCEAYAKLWSVSAL